MTTKTKTRDGLWRCPGCQETTTDDWAADSSWRWNGEAWEHRCDGLHPQVGHLLAEFVPTPKLPMNKWSHPEWSGSLIAEPNFTREEVIEGYLSDLDEAAHADLTVEPIHMTQDDIDALPEFEGY